MFIIIIFIRYYFYRYFILLRINCKDTFIKSHTINFKRKLVKEDITYRNMLVNMLCESTSIYPSKRLMTIATEDLYNLYYRGMNYISGRYNIMNFTATFLNEE